MKRGIDPKAVSVRLIQRMKELDISGADITRATGASSAAITKWRQGVNTPSRYALQLANLLQTTPEWLMYGEGLNAELGTPASGEARQKRSPDVSKFGTFRLWSSNDPLPEDEYVHLPYMKEVQMKGGTGNVEMQDYNGFTLPFGKSTLYRNGVNPARAFCCTLDGDSMEPVIPDGATIGVNMEDNQIKDGKVYAFRHDDLFRVKRLYRISGGQVRINSFNQDDPAYKDEIIAAEDIEIIGRVFYWSVMA